MNEDADQIVTMLKDNGLTDEQINFLIRVLNKIREDKRTNGDVGPDSSVRSVLEQITKQ